MSPLIPLLILLVGAALLLLGLLPRFAYTGALAITAAALALAALLGLVFFLPATATLSAWGPASLLRRGLVLQIDPQGWLFGMGILTVTLATLLTGVARPGGRRIAIRGAMLLLALAGLVAVFSDDLLTRIMAWAGLDLVYFLALVVLGRSEGLEPQAVLNLAFNSIGTLLAVGAALMISRESATLSLREAALTPQSTLLMTLAAVFRLGLFPLHLALPAEANLRQGLGTLLRLIPAAVALEVVGRLAVFGFAEVVRPWLTLFAVIAALVGAAQLWRVAEPRLGITYLIIAESGLALLAGLWGGAQASVALTAWSVSLLLGGALVYLAPGHDARRSWLTIWPALGLVFLLGVPLTIGYAGLGGLYQGLWETGNGLVLMGVGLAQVFLTAGLFRAVFWPGQLENDDPLRQLAYLGGLTPLMLFGVVAGMLGGMINSALGVPADSFNYWAWAGVLITAVAGFALWRFEGLVRSPTEVAGSALAALFRIDWLYRLAWGGLHGVSTLVANLAAVLEGEGAMLWTLVAVLLVWLFFR